MVVHQRQQWSETSVLVALLIGCLSCCDSTAVGDDPALANRGGSTAGWEPFFVRNPAMPRASPTEECPGGVCSDGGVQHPNVAPSNPSSWRSTGWCTSRSTGGESCPDKALAAWVQVHEAARRSPKDGRFLACKPMGGMGNFIAGSLSCLAVAIATNRSLLMAQPPPQPAGRPIYEEPVESIFDLPIDTSLAPLGPDVKDVPLIIPDQIPSIQTIDIRSHDLLCRNLSDAYTAPVVVLPAHLWLGAVPDNHEHASFFTRSFGRDEFGISPVASFLGPWLFRPEPRLLTLLSSLHLIASPAGVLEIVAVQARVGLDVDAQALSDRPPPGSGPDFVRCAFSQTPTAHRSKAKAWVLAGDRAETRAQMLEAVAAVEGPIVAGSGVGRLRRLLPAWLFSPSGVEELEMDEELGAYGFSVAVFASGSRAVLLAWAEDDTWSRRGMEAAMLEMWLLAYASVLVVSENSTFWLPGVTFARAWGASGAWKGRKRGVYIFTRGSRCYPLPTEEPLTDGGHRIRTMWGSPCFDDAMLTPALTWLPPLQGRSKQG